MRSTCFYEWQSFLGDRGSDRTMRCAPTPLNTTDMPGSVTFVLEGDAPEDVPAFVRYPLVSDRLRRAVETAQLTGVQFFPVRVESRLSVPVPRYWYAHFAIVDNAIDYEESMWQPLNLPPFPDGRPPIAMIKFVLKSAAISGLDFLRCRESKSPIFSSIHFQQLFITGGFTGLGFTPVPTT